MIGFHLSNLKKERSIWWHHGMKWDRVPINVSCRGYNSKFDSMCEPEGRAAIEIINQTLGFQILRYNTEGYQYTPGIEILLGVPRLEGELAAGSAQLTWIPNFNTLYSCEVVIVDDVEINMLSLIFQHELGHCLNLEHDDDDMTSIMFPRGDKMVKIGNFPRITNEDREALRSLYLN